ncbi:MAG: DNA primase [Alphaproteobacteria bacterium]|nr:DNA primase [Alphaproteobacteria bacterium]
MSSITPRFIEELRMRLSLADIVGKRVKLTSKGREHSGLCPFHNEKTPSFTVNEDKGFYHCFGCGAHGDMIKFVMDTEKMPFREAVEYLANLAGIPMPKDSPRQEAYEKKYAGLSAIMEEACRFFQENLFGLSGKNARNYLIGRGISGNIAKQFRLGYAPHGSQLAAHLRTKGYSMTDCISLGLVGRRQDGTFYDYFYDRVMFPILDRRKRVIGFGGRIMGKGEPKYLNSPETTLFHKGEQLYALPNAIETIRKKNSAILVEGYMDVIALHSTGFTNAVAPLGTALTDNQIKLLWQFCDEPIICFDGDNAGRRAAIRAVNRALPILQPGKSLRFVWLPDTMDPDDVIRKKSPEIFEKLLETAKPLTFALWYSLLEGRLYDTPERMAKLKQDTLDTANQIQNEIVRGYYIKELKKQLWQLEKNKKENHRTYQNIAPMIAPTPGISEARMMIAYLICYPHVAQKILEDLGALIFQENELNNAIHTISDLIFENPDITTSEMLANIPEDISQSLKGEIEMLKKSQRSERQVTEELRVWIQNSRIKALETDIQIKTKEFSENSSSELWEQIVTLKKEIENLQESE